MFIVLASSKDRVRKQKEVRKIIFVTRTIFFVIGILGLALIILNFWVDTGKIGGVLCSGALIGHLATNLESETDIQPPDQNRKS